MLTLQAPKYVPVLFTVSRGLNNRSGAQPLNHTRCSSRAACLFCRTSYFTCGTNFQEPTVHIKRASCQYVSYEYSPTKCSARNTRLSSTMSAARPLHRLDMESTQVNSPDNSEVPTCVRGGGLELGNREIRKSRNSKFPSFLIFGRGGGQIRKFASSSPTLPASQWDTRYNIIHQAADKPLVKTSPPRKGWDLQTG